MTTWRTEAEAIAILALTDVDHCGSCHGEMAEGYPTHEIELPDGAVAAVCCGVHGAIERRKAATEKRDGGD